MSRKKELPPIAIVGIVLGILLVLGLGSIVLLGAFGALTWLTYSEQEAVQLEEAQRQYEKHKAEEERLKLEKEAEEAALQKKLQMENEALEKEREEAEKILEEAEADSEGLQEAIRKEGAAAGEGEVAPGDPLGGM